jgi:hypothetical protein
MRAKGIRSISRLDERPLSVFDFDTGNVLAAGDDEVLEPILGVLQSDPSRFAAWR